jgi:Helix-turn-helix of DDE superfamily endonuclease
MTDTDVKDLKPAAFKRLCGVRPETFARMLSLLEQGALQKRKPGRPSKLSLPDQLLLTLQYWREYRTYFHVGQFWGVNESTA